MTAAARYDRRPGTGGGRSAMDVGCPHLDAESTPEIPMSSNLFHLNTIPSFGRWEIPFPLEGGYKCTSEVTSAHRRLQVHI